jgi:hypothetical protein
MRHSDKHACSSVQRQVRNGSTLDSTSVRGPSPAAAATTAGQAADDDAEEGDDGVDDRLKTSSDGVDNGHDAVSDGAENRLDARYYGTHCCGVVLVCVLVMLLVQVGGSGLFEVEDRVGCL